MKESKVKMLQQQKAAEQFMREHRALWRKPSGFETISLDENPEAFDWVFEIAESNPEYLLMEHDVDLVDIMCVSDSDSAATESESVQSANPFNF